MFLGLIGEGKKAEIFHTLNINKMITGIDCSKDSFDLAVLGEEKLICTGKHENNLQGFKKALKQIKGSELVVMEATGPYYLPLAMYLHEKGVKVSVVNPLVIKRFSQMRMTRTKTDKADALLIARYGLTEKPKAWIPPKGFEIKLQQMNSYIDRLNKSKTMAENQLHAFSHTGALDKGLEKELLEEIKGYKMRIVENEKQMHSIIKEEHKNMMESIESIPGIGSKTATLLILKTRGFELFEDYKQVVSYLGVAPRIYDSGTSVRGKARICKMGMGSLRAKLYMAAYSAKKYNPPCKALYERLRLKGKAHRVALIAVVNKLIKQAFAIAKSRIPFNAEHSNTFAVNSNSFK